MVEWQEELGVVVEELREMVVDFEVKVENLKVVVDLDGGGDDGGEGDRAWGARVDGVGAPPAGAHRRRGR